MASRPLCEARDDVVGRTPRGAELGGDCACEGTEYLLGPKAPAALRDFLAKGLEELGPGEALDVAEERLVGV